MSGRMTKSVSRNAAMNMPPPPPYAFHGCAGTWAQSAYVTGSSSGYQPSWDQYIPQPDVGVLSWQSARSAEWQQPRRTDWGYGSSSSGGPFHSSLHGVHILPEAIMISLKGSRT